MLCVVVNGPWCVYLSRVSFQGQMARVLRRGHSFLTLSRYNRNRGVGHNESNAEL